MPIFWRSLQTPHRSSTCPQGCTSLFATEACEQSLAIMYQKTVMQAWTDPAASLDRIVFWNIYLTYLNLHATSQSIAVWTNSLDWACCITLRAPLHSHKLRCSANIPRAFPNLWMGWTPCYWGTGINVSLVWVQLMYWSNNDAIRYSSPLSRPSKSRNTIRRIKTRFSGSHSIPCTCIQ